MLPLLGQPLRELARGRRLSCALQTEQNHDSRPLGGRRQSALAVAKQRQHLVANDLDDRLRRREALEDLFLHRPVAHPVDESLDDLEIDVRFEKREANLAQGGLDVLRREPSLASQRLEDILEAIAQGVEHAALNLSTVNHYRIGPVAVGQPDDLKAFTTRDTKDTRARTPIFFVSFVSFESFVVSVFQTEDSLCPS